MLAGSAWAVQMLLVAFSRRMCLLARLQGQAQGWPALRVFRNPHQSAGNQPFISVARGEERRVRSAITSGTPNRCALPTTTSAPNSPAAATRSAPANPPPRLATRPPHTPGRQNSHNQKSRRPSRDIAPARQKPCRGIESSGDRPSQSRCPTAGAGARDFDGLRMALFRNKKNVPVRLHILAQMHRLGGGGCLVEQRRVGHRQPGQLTGHGLEIEQRLESACAISA